LDQIEEGIDQSEFIEAISRLYNVSFKFTFQSLVDLRLVLSKQAYSNV